MNADREHLEAVLFTVANGEFYGQERPLTAVRDRMRLPAGELFGEVLAEVQERRVWREFEDDVSRGHGSHAHGIG